MPTTSKNLVPVGLVCFFVSAIFLNGCTKSSPQLEGPQGSLSKYVGLSFSIKSPGEKAGLEALTTGEVKAALGALDDVKFKAFFVDSKREFVAMKIKDDRKISDNAHSITYELSYMSHTPNTKDLVTTKKSAMIVFENGKWLISEVRGVKTVIEHQNEITF